METWSLNHPEHGLIEVRIGYDTEFLETDPSWPGELPERFVEHPELIKHIPANGSVAERLRAGFGRPPTRLEVRVNGEVQTQYEELDSGRIPLFGQGPKDALKIMTHFGVDRAKPHLNLTFNIFKELLEVDYREGKTVVEFDPPEGSRGARRRQAMESSNIKRTFFPIAQGIGKGGWALAVLLLPPVIGRFLAWIAQHLPDIDLPDFTLPQIRLPHVDLPVPQLPQVRLPTPNIALPDLPDLPYWVAWLLEYSKIWVPVLIGIVIGVVALRNKKKSDAEKAKWEEQES
ncbi:hypothetical protein [Corynebacterium sp. HMSC29G08]|uniref:hypothetical protein n=1 Tax=Corynebacterium sp. HMSC29G08 TaxID=1581069 RepID=UPI0008A3E9BB|nr:hypothetical protein [Corynebacterium sp. HMSC29G08]OFT85826.1 hypothetical protein HMPREF3101_01770 [Corynebacterium sp. HMSC29G08]